MMAKNKPRISVVIPTYNRAADLQRALKSVFAQSFTDWEILVVDNNSTDGTDSVVSGFNDKRVSIHKVQNHGIIAVSRNKGISEARGEFIAFLDSDDWWTSDKLEKSIDYLDKGYDLIYHDLWIVSKNNQNRFFKKVGVRKLVKPVFDDLILHGSAIPNSSVVVRTDLLRKINGLSEDKDLIAAEDYDCWLRLALTTNRFACIPEVLGYYWQGLHNNSNPDRKYVNMRELQRLYFEPYIRKHNIEMPTWILYQNVRTDYLLENFQSAASLINVLLGRSLDWIVRMKLLYMWVKTKLYLAKDSK